MVDLGLKKAGAEMRKAVMPQLLEFAGAIKKKTIFDSGERLMLTDDEIKEIKKLAVKPDFFSNNEEITIVKLANRLLEAEAKIKVLEEALREIEAFAVKWEFYPVANRARAALQEQSK